MGIDIEGPTTINPFLVNISILQHSENTRKPLVKEILAKNGLRDCRHISLLSAFEGMNDFLFLPEIIRKTTENLNQKHNLVTIP